MKYWIAIIFLAVVTASCTKTKTVTVTTPPVHDTTVITVHDTITTKANIRLLGKWAAISSSALMNPIFTNDSVFWNSYVYKYAASNDTIFHVYSYNNITPVYTYYFSTDGDTLYLTPTAPAYIEEVYRRTN